jgi:hypothetical protein
MDPLHVDLILIILVAVVSGIVGMVTLRLSQRFERKLILRKKRFEKEYEIAERIISDSSELLIVVDNLGNSIRMHFEFKKMLADGVLTEEEQADFISFFKIYVNPKVKLEDLKRDLRERPDETIAQFRDNIVKYYVSYVELMHKILTYANEHTVEFYFKNPRINEGLDLLKQLMLEVNRIYVEYTYKDMDYKEVSDHMRSWCDSIKKELRALISILDSEIHVEVESRGR